MNYIGIIKFKTGNIKSILQTFDKLKIDFKIKIIKNTKDFKKIDRLIIPGQGSILNCINYLKIKEFFQIIKNFENPILGICVGKHLFFKRSEENYCKSLNILLGTTKKFYNINKFFKIPNIGWNKVYLIKKHFLINNLKITNFFYFIHSFYILPKNYNHVYGISKYNTIFSSIFIKNNIFITQFHPEKSGVSGMKLCYNFSKWKI